MKTVQKIALIFTVILLAVSSHAQTEMYQEDKVASDSDSGVKEIRNKTVEIGKSEWMLDNLSVTKYQNGDPIREAKTPEEWANCLKKEEGCWCNYENKETNGKEYGKLYNWYAVDDSRGLAPKGWHVPSAEEWDNLVEELGGKEEAGKKMKSSLDWSDNCNASNSSGFFGLPSGFRSSEGKFFFLNSYALWWSSTSYKSATAWYMYLYCNLDFAVKYYYSKGDGFSVRVVKD